jgi:type VI protein secretion system component VasF
MSMADDSGTDVAPDTGPAEQPAPTVPPAEPNPQTPPSEEGGGSATEDSQAPPQPPGPQPETLVDAIADLLQMFVNWMRAEASDIMRDKVVLPVQQLGLTLASASAAGCLVVIGLHFIFVAILLVLAEWLGWPGALLLVGGVILLGAGGFTYVKMRSIQK